MSKINRYFDSSVAREVGTDAAIILYNLQFWIEKNQANNKHFYDEKYWTYNSIKAFQVLFDWLSVQNIKTCLNKLEKQGYIITGNYNATQYDRTKWYALSNKCNVTNQPIHLLESTNGLVSSNQPIPYIKPDDKTDNKLTTTSKKSKIDNTEAYKELMDLYNQLYEKNTKSYASWKENCDYWLEHYTLIDIKKALFFSRKFGWWAKEPTLDLILRTKNKNGQKVDYIDQLLNSKEAIAFQQPVDPLTAAIRKNLGYDD